METMVITIENQVLNNKQAAFMISVLNMYHCLTYEQAPKEAQTLIKKLLFKNNVEVAS